MIKNEWLKKKKKKTMLAFEGQSRNFIALEPFLQRLALIGPP